MISKTHQSHASQFFTTKISGRGKLKLRLRGTKLNKRWKKIKKWNKNKDAGRKVCDIVNANSNSLNFPLFFLFFEIPLSVLFTENTLVFSSCYFFFFVFNGEKQRHKKNEWILKRLEETNHVKSLRLSGMKIYQPRATGIEGKAWGYGR